MQFEAPLVPGRLIRRYQRFFAEVALDDGTLAVAHCPNPGSMRTCAFEGERVWIRPCEGASGRLGWSWELAEHDGAMIVVNTARANRVVAEALAAGAIPELGGYGRITAEPVCGEDNRFDFLLEEGGRRCWLEVKSATMAAGFGIAAFPDAITMSGSRHLDELAIRARRGQRAALLFCASRSDVRSVRPADDIDEVYGSCLRRAVAAGVEVLAYRCEISTTAIRLAERIPVSL